MQDEIYEWTWVDKDGNKRRATTVGRYEYNDQYAYLNQLEQADLVSSIECKYFGEDI